MNQFIHQGCHPWRSYMYSPPSESGVFTIHAYIETNYHYLVFPRAFKRLNRKCISSTTKGAIYKWSLSPWLAVRANLWINFAQLRERSSYFFLRYFWRLTRKWIASSAARGVIPKAPIYCNIYRIFKLLNEFCTSLGKIVIIYFVFKTCEWLTRKYIQFNYQRCQHTWFLQQRRNESWKRSMRIFYSS